MNQQQPITLLISALGGEGGGVLTEWLVDTARHAGYPAQSTSIPGVAQRTGATTYYIEVFPVKRAELGGRRPVFSLNPVPGALDAMVSSELLETARQVGNGMTAPDRTLVITSSARTLTTQERMQLGDGRAEPAELLKIVRQFSRAHQVFDMAAVARETGTVVSAVMLGAIAGSGLFPFRREDYEAVVKAGGKGVEASLRGFARACEIVSQGKTQSDYVAQVLAPAAEPAPAGTLAPQASPPQHPHRGVFPPTVQEMFALGYARLLEYQDKGYAELYARRLRSVLDAEREADPQGVHGFATTREMARWLALWMAFDDIVRVAHLKSRASRWQRVRGEVKPGEEDLLKLYDHFKPGVPEFAALLPASLAGRLVAWDRRRVAAGRQPWALPLKIGTHGVFGMLALRTLAAARWLRPHGSRFALEQRMIVKWLQGVVDGTRRHWQLGQEIALCGRLIKGYGATNERGKENLLHVLDHLAQGGDPQAAALAVAAARSAALADDAGKALDATLAAHGAPARPVKAQPIRFMRKPEAAKPRQPA
ncbi:indolepyruvate oxidoreductase subunit beta family protein [Ramlibacter tataouinensis]|uniref:Indolepyruvate ferredoxin oxidoreductase beta subunit-like protein n=1 Tax=Ramlibacter tataouinensis (strain ATCC BAA-407 / DSM 14655 / LMG 21543 / TTB310) TaxID=365046 RepID=F5XY32_RAMTT|nr:indolepyruvate oxidoreductase subunit beta family protein [Ramlibacter tataouinensis]AEG94357.1 indolepyruvate ferredoxin oxidoreductase beta subunit-like protein [Ramlibacter tataouinensis TTB310]